MQELWLKMKAISVNYIEIQFESFVVKQYLVIKCSQKEFIINKTIHVNARKNRTNENGKMARRVGL